MSQEDISKLEKVMKGIVSDYDILDVLQALRNACHERADELADMRLSDSAKPLTRVAFHLAIFGKE